MLIIWWGAQARAHWRIVSLYFPYSVRSVGQVPTLRRNKTAPPPKSDPTNHRATISVLHQTVRAPLMRSHEVTELWAGRVHAKISNKCIYIYLKTQEMLQGKNIYFCCWCNALLPPPTHVTSSIYPFHPALREAGPKAPMHNLWQCFSTCGVPNGNTPSTNHTNLSAKLSVLKTILVRHQRCQGLVKSVSSGPTLTWTDISISSEVVPDSFPESGPEFLPHLVLLYFVLTWVCVYWLYAVSKEHTASIIRAEAI
jgi:hypothetical protein